MKRAIIIHCWGGKPNYCWYPDTKKNLESQGFQVSVPAMPDTDNPDQEKWVPVLKEAVGTPDQEVYLIGHSIGVATIFRYLEDLPEGQRIGGAVLVAGFTDNLGYEEISNYFQTPLDFAKIKSHCGKWVLIHSDNDPYVPLKYGDELKGKLGAELIIKHKMGHFSGPIDNEKSCTELPDVVDPILKISK
jgi:uncharacterized protein